MVIELCFNLLEGSRYVRGSELLEWDWDVANISLCEQPDVKSLQIQLTGFLDKDTGKFCKELWSLCLSAQENPQGVPKELLEAKKLELIQEKVCLVYTSRVRSGNSRLRARSKPKKQPKSPNARKSKSAYVNASYKIFDRGNDSIAAEEGDEVVVAGAGTLIDARSETTDHHPGGAAETVSVNLLGESLIPTFRQGFVEVVGRRGRSAALLLGHRLRRGPRRGDVVGQLAAPRLRSEEIAEGQGDAVRPGLLVAVIHRVRVRPRETEGGDPSPAIRRARARRLPIAIGGTLHIRDRDRGRGRGRGWDLGHCLGSQMIDGENLMQEHIRERQRLILERPAPVITAA